MNLPSKTDLEVLLKWHGVLGVQKLFPGIELTVDEVAPPKEPEKDPVEPKPVVPAEEPNDEYGIEYMNQKEVCQYLDMDRRTLARLIEEQHIPQPEQDPRDGRNKRWPTIKVRAARIRLENLGIWPQ